MKKITLLICLLIVLAGCATTKKDTLVVGFTDYPPMGFKNDQGEIVGFDIDFANAVSEVMDVPFEFQYINWDSKVLELNSNQIDFVWNGFTVTPEREKEVLFSMPYIENSIVIITRSDDDSIQSFDDLTGKTVNVESESSGQNALEDLLGDKLSVNRFTSISEALLDLKAGNSDAVVADEIYGRYLVGNDDSVKVVPNASINSENYAVGLRLENTDLLKDLNAAIQTVIDSGVATEISIKWFGEDIIKR